jgi:hypothetical protein
MVIRDTAPAFTLDICHPLQSLDQPSLPEFVPPAHTVALVIPSPDRGAGDDVPRRLVSRLLDSLDPDPPEVSS